MGVTGLHQTQIESAMSPFFCSVVVVGSVSGQRELSSDVTAAFVHQVAIESLSEEQRMTMLASLSEDLMLGKDINLGKISKQTAVRLSSISSTHSNFPCVLFYTLSWSNCETFQSILYQR